MANTFDVQMPDGTTVRGVPEGTTQSQLQAMLDKNSGQNPAYTGTNQYLDLTSMSIKERPNNGLDTFVMGLGQRFNQAKNALNQITDQLTTGKVDPQTQADVDEASQIDKPLDATPEGKLGNMTGTAVLASAAPGGYAGAATGGAIAGATEPTQGDQSRITNTAAGAAGGLAGQAAGSLGGAIASRVISPIRNSLNSVRQAAVDLLKAHGVPLDLFQQTGDRAVLSLKNSAADSPVLNPSDFKDQQASAFTGAALKQMGIQGADEATPATMQAGKQALKSTYDQIASRNTIKVDLQNPNADPLLSGLNTVSLQAHRGLRPDDYRVVQNQLDDVVNAIHQGNGTISGEQYQNIQSALGRVSGDGGKAPYVTDIRQALTAALQRQATPGDAALLAQTNQRYGAMKSIEKAIGDDNQVSPAKLFNAMDTKRGANATVYGQGANQDLVNLAQAGKIVLGKGTPNSGTPQRLAGIALAGTAGGIIDAKAHGGTVETPLATLAAGIGGPALARSIIENPKVANALAAWARNQGIRTAQDVTSYLAKRTGSIGGAVAGSQMTNPPTQ